MSGWVYWVIAAVAFATIEAISTTLFIIPFSVGAIAAAAADLLGAGGPVQAAAFLVLSAVAFTVTRPIARRHRTMPPQIRTGTAALIGCTATVLEEVSGESGAIKLGGEVWSARPYDEDDTIAVGSRVQVIQIKGATALVSE
jgi:membrane protein implicated in regulation of membrane protease activity